MLGPSIVVVSATAWPLWAAPVWPGAETVDAQELSALDHTQRQRAAERLTIRGGPEMRAGLLGLLDDSAPQVRLTAARILAQQGVPEAIEAATRWTISATPSNRRLGLDVLREAPGPLPAPALRAVERSLSDADLTVRLLAVDTLAQQRDLTPSMLPLAAASEDDNREVRVRAIRALAASHDRRAVVPLLARLGDVDRQVRIEAMEGLALLGDVRAAPALKRQLGDPADDVRVAAALALGKLKVADAVPAIAELTRRPPFEEISRQASLALGDIATPDAIAVLIEHLREPPVADEVAAGLLRAGNAAVPALLVEARRGTATSSAAAVTLLGELRAGSAGADRAVAALLAQIVGRRAAGGTSATSATISAAIGAMALIKDPESLPALLDAAGDPLPETRRACYRALIAIGDDRALAILERGLADRDAQVRTLALRLGASFGQPGPAALTAVAARLADPDLAVAREAARALVRLRWRVPGTVAPLLALLERAPPESALDRVSDRAPPGPTGSTLADTLTPALADALAIMAAPGDDAALAAALRRLPTDGRRVVARALAAAHAAQPINDGALVDLLVASLLHEPAEAEAAADALALARGVRGRETAVLRAFDTVAPDVRPHLCTALATLGGSAGRERLIAIVADAGALADVRAAAAWALPVAPDLRRDDLAEVAALRFALTRASTSTDTAVSANARAALAVLALPAAGAPASRTELHVGWAGVRLRARDGAALPHAWLSLTAADGTTVWTQSALDGVARVAALPAGPYQVRLRDQTLTMALRSTEAPDRIAPSSAPRP
jgi:HEAT repeat protein